MATALVNEALQRFEDNSRRIANAIANFNKVGRNNHTRAITEGRAKLLEKYWSDAQQASTQVDVHSTAEDRETLEYYTDDLLEKTEEQYLQAYDFFQEKLAEYAPPAVSASGGPARSSGVGSGPTSASTEFKLPTISVPTFSGNLTDWIAFRDLFSSLITSRVGLSDVHKLHYLLSVVTDDAAKLISHISLSDQNFAVAWTILKDHYENQRTIINAHLANFFAIPPVAPNDTVNGLKRLRANSSESIHALQALQRPVEQWNDILVFCLVQKFDKNTRREWEVHLGDDREYPTIAKLNKFLDTRIRSLEAAATGQPSDKAPESSGKKEGKSNPRALRSHHGATTVACVVCSEPHKLAQCDKFKSKSITERQQCAQQNALCINCLTKGHTTADCRSTFTCFHCKRRHHPLLHESRRDRSQGSTANPAVQVTTSKLPDPHPSTAEQAGANMAHAHVATQAQVPSKAVLLATAWVHLVSDQGRQIQARALIDPGSDASFISENLVQCLRLTRERTNAYVTSIGGQSADTVKSTVQLNIGPIQDPSKVKLRIKALVLPKITAYLPSKARLDMTFARGLVLADPVPTSSAPIELLLGADLYADILIDGLRKEPSHKLILQNTIFGWIISGAVSNPKPSPRTIHIHHASVQEITTKLLQFFKTEEVPMRKYLTSAEQRCESHFETTHYTLPEEGTSVKRYVVRLPFKTNPPIPIGDTRARALASYRNLEKRLQRDTELDQQYSAFLHDYRESNHMEPRKLNSCDTPAVFLPHHPVIKDSTTTKVRVVFNASSPSSNGSSLNDHLLPGPNLQPELVAVILNWRNSRYVYTADIAQMFRQILVDPRDQNYQLIFWRPSPEEEIQSYALTTVTYGTACAPYLAQRVLLQVAEDRGREFPLAVPILKKHRYMDDLMFGADSKESALQKRRQITDCLSRAGFSARKWASNDPTLLAGIESKNHGLALKLPLEEESRLKILGLNWEPSSDSFRIVAQLSDSPLPTKRQILSVIARCFDPLGWLAPVLVGPKILVQQLWLLKLGWDDPVPEEKLPEWQSFCNQLPCLNQITIPRWTSSDGSTSVVQIHGFCDASERAYAAGAYLRVSSAQAEVKISLMIAKTRVAPLKTITIPRLELCAAVLLVRCVSTLLETISMPVESITCWSDSSVVLCWLKKSPSSLKSFTAHRVAEIQTQLPQARWKHVPSEDNPADCASRGLSPSQLREHSLWWHGPRWLSSAACEWPDQSFLDFTSTEVDSKSTNHVHLQMRGSRPEGNNFGQLLQDVSTWSRLLRITAYVLRFIRRVRRTTPAPTALALQVEEVRAAETFWLRYAQKETFPAEVKAIANRAAVSTKSPLKGFDPIMDDLGVIRLGGRLHQADLPHNQKHPVILASHRVSRLIIEHIHRTTLHGGTQLMLRVLRQNYWILRARNLVKSATNNCIRCTRERAQTRSQFMASLPKARVVPSRPFSHSGVDYAGPVLVRNAAGRGRTSHKAYIALFICFATRAIHLELVQDYSAAAFVAAFQRFASRRGLPSHMYSDNGTTFQGAERELREAFNAIVQEVDFRNLFATDQVEWQFLPPAAPHFGGLWEAGVKSVKYHLKRILQNSTPTVEELTTLLCNIEAILNSRPIAPLSDDPTSYDVLTPGHFLIGEPLKTVPLPSTLHLNENRLDRWQLVQRRVEQFWKVWAQDYIHSLQQRVKWQKREPNLQIGDLVLIRNENLPPSKWNLARVLECFPDRDNFVRSVRVKTATSEYIRPIVKLCKLPVSTESEPQPPEPVVAAPP